MSAFILQELRKVIIDNEIRNSSQYHVFRYNNAGMFDGKPLPSNPWQIERKTAKKFFDEIYPDRVASRFPRAALKYSYYEKKPRATLQEHFDYVKLHNITSVREYITASKAKDFPANLYISPWSTFNMKVKDFFASAIENIKELRYLKRRKQVDLSDIDLVKLCIENKLTNSRKWHKFVKDKGPHHGLVSRPWDRFFVTENEFFTAVRTKNLSHLESRNVFQS